MKINELCPYSLKTIAIALVLVLLELVCFAANGEGSQAQTGPAQDAVDVNQLVAGFMARESESKAAFGNHGYRCDLIVQHLKDGKVLGEFRRATQVTLDKAGKLEEKVLPVPTPSLTEVIVTREDLEGLSAKYLFTLETANASKYKVKYAGTERVDNVDTYVFDVQPKAVQINERLFNGRIWVRVSDLRIVKLRGRAVQKGNQRFPMIESHRTSISDHLFPSHAVADEKLEFPNGRSAHLRMEVRYSDYVKLK